MQCLNLDLTMEVGKMFCVVLRVVVFCWSVTCIGCFDNGTFASDTKEELTCGVRELVTCGNSMGYYSWEFCRPRTQGTLNISSAHLDLRYPNRYCRSYGTPKNFGLTEAGDSMWVIKSCFGTFLLCLEVESSSQTTEEVQTSTSPTLFWSEQDNSHEDSISLDYHRTPQHGDSTTNHVTTTSYHVTVTTNHVTIPSDHVTDSKTVPQFQTGGSRRQNVTTGVDGPIEIIVNEKESLDLTTKVLLIAAIATAGLCLICLVVTVGWFMMSRRGRSETTKRIPNEIDPEETTGTSLPVAEFQDQEGIYNVIPCDEDAFVLENENAHVKSVPEVKHYEQSDLHIYASVQRQNSQTGSTLSVPMVDGNEYDCLRNTPRVSVSHISTYDRIANVIRDEQCTDELSFNIPNDEYLS